ncbi:MAG TPA: exosortase E/protease, VPEID-CTERM system [Vicinamibacterales bacterium]|nr:exosortase E/protease, VPEID-CTERM system [Vicinamibacterales bacterium]
MAILVLELVAFRAWLPAFSPDQAGTLTAVLTEKGPGTLRFVVVQFAVAFGMVSLLFGETRIASLRPILTRFAQRGVVWRPLVAHGVSVLLFAGISTILSAVYLATAPGVTLAALWTASAAASVGSLGIAFMPAAFWTLLFRRTRHALAFAAVVGVGAYAFGRLALTLWRPLSHTTLVLAYAMLHPIVPALAADPSSLTMGVPGFRVQIGAPCSGYEGLGLMLVFLAAWLWFRRAEWRFPHALVMVPIGLAGVWILNCVRVAGLILIGIAGAPDVAMGGFHSQAGWVGFNAVALGACLVARRVPWLLRHDAKPASAHSSRSNPTAMYLMPFLAVLAGSMAAQLASAGFEWLYAMRVALAAAALCYFLPKYRTLEWRIGWTSLALGGFVFVVWVALDAFSSGGSQVNMPVALAEAPATWRMGWIAARVVGSVITVPIAEELAFRGFLLRRLDADDFQSIRGSAVSWVAILLSSAAFGALHGERWLAGTIAGVVYGVAYVRRGSIGDAVAAHATTNALIAAEVLIAGHWQFW